MTADPLERLRARTPARVFLGRCGTALPTGAMLEFQLAHARARDAVHHEFEPERVAAALPSHDARIVRSLAIDRRTYLQRPDLGRRLDDSSAASLSRGDYEAVFVVADGLSARAVHEHAAATLAATLPQLAGWRLGPVIVARHARVALGDEIGERLGAQLAVVLIGERPGLSAPDSLGVYLTWQPRVGRVDSERNCISNIRPHAGLSYDQAAGRMTWLMNMARHLRLTGIALKEESGRLTLPPRMTAR
ncbi:MAG TPA: ethanolamine ammonia-lyase subunit EutC [Steroidobacteraceae bacterium]|nr:ethanolamine ammonia-lyase subunit EutC [Steroidobacteraceae bacterium]